MDRPQEQSRNADLPPDFLQRLEAVSARRPKIVIDHILEHGHVTTEELRELYGYDHPPRAARDVREQGIPLETFRVVGKQGRRIGAYRFGDPSEVRRGRLGGRRAWPKNLKKDLLEAQGSRCAVCLTEYLPRELQIDHSIPYEIGGEPKDPSDLGGFMLLCGSCNRAKSWSCEHCLNWTDERDPDICRTCYWASPETYTHIALRLIRRLDITWTDSETRDYDRLVALSKQANEELPEFVKGVIRTKLNSERRAE